MLNGLLSINIPATFVYEPIKNMKMKLITRFLMALAITFGFVACNDDDDSSAPLQTARLSVQMVDGPGDYDAVNIDVQDVRVTYSDTEEEISIGDINTGVYDLLQLTGGVSVLLADNEIPAGDLSQIRLVLGEDNTIVVDGETYPLSTPSAQQSGLKIQVHQTLEPDVFYEYILDFDVEESIVVQGNGGYSLKPVINASLVADAGQIAGIVIPNTFQTLVTAVDADQLVEVSTYTSAEGDYILYGLPEGTYTVTFEADPALGFPPIIVPDVEVVAGLTTVLDDVIFE